MKTAKLFFIVLFVFVLFFPCAAFGSGSQNSAPAEEIVLPERQINSGIPQFIRDAIKNAPEDALIGIGTARMRTPSQSMTMSATRARAELSRQIDTVLRDMVRDYSAGSEVDPELAVSFSESITVALSQSRFQGSNIIDVDEVDGNYWTIVALSRNGVVNEINQAVSAAKLAVPKMESFNAEDRMLSAFEKFYLQNEIGYFDGN